MISPGKALPPKEAIIISCRKIRANSHAGEFQSMCDKRPFAQQKSRNQKVTQGGGLMLALFIKN